jgi:methanogenic corrinoid protein MtbC1
MAQQNPEKLEEKLAFMINDELYSRYVTALLQGDVRLCAEIVTHLLKENTETTTIYTELFQKSLYRVGELWEMNRVSVAVEHLATAITERMLANVYPALLTNVRPNGRKALICCSVNEYHQIGARMVADIMETRGWDVSFLGANTPVNDMLLMIQEKQSEILGLSVSIYFNMASLHRTIEIVRASFPGLNIFVGGQGFRWGGTDISKKFSNIEYVPSIQTLDTIIAGR